MHDGSDVMNDDHLGPSETSAKGGTVELLAPVCGTNKKDHKF